MTDALFLLSKTQGRKVNITEEKNNITVFAESEQERLEREKQERHQRMIANLKPLKKYSELTEQERIEQHELRSKGGKKRQEQVAKQKSLKETTKALLKQRVTKAQAQRILGDDVNLLDDTENIDVQAVLTVRLIQAVLVDNSVKAMEYLRDTSGEKPVSTNEIELNANIMTDDDRDLLKSVSNRLGVG